MISGKELHKKMRLDELFRDMEDYSMPVKTGKDLLSDLEKRDKIEEELAIHLKNTYRQLASLASAIAHMEDKLRYYKERQKLLETITSAQYKKQRNEINAMSYEKWRDSKK